MQYYPQELKSLQSINDLQREQPDDSVNRHLIHPIAACRRGPDRYFFFHWAEKGSLRAFWRNSHTSITADIVVWTINQFLGLSKAVHAFHDRNTRHGDIKPENILAFDDPEQEYPRLVLGDVGLTRAHTAATMDRTQPTDTHMGTTRYEAPEARVDQERLGGARSRRFDIWSHGCLLLEHLIWILWGPRELEELQKSITQFWSEDGVNCTIHPAVTALLQRLSADPRCQKDTAIKDLLDLVREKMLVVATDPNTNNSQLPPPGIRATASDVVARLQAILLKSTEKTGGPQYTFQESLWCQQRDRRAPHMPHIKNGFLAPGRPLPQGRLPESQDVDDEVGTVVAKGVPTISRGQSDGSNAAGIAISYSVVSGERQFGEVR